MPVGRQRHARWRTPPASFFDDCEAKWANPNNPPDNAFDCFMMALCLAHNEAGGLRDRINAINSDKAAAQAAHDNAMAAVKAQAQAAVNAAQAVRAGANAQLQNQVGRIQRTRTGVMIVGGVISTVGGVVILAGESGASVAAGTVGGAKVAAKDGGFAWKNVFGGLSAVAGGVTTGFGIADWLSATSAVNQSVTSQNQAFVAATAGPMAAFNAQNAIHLPALQAACNLAAQRRTAAQQAY
ncbi:MAG: hypothetical protein D6692_08605, partial [Planctomycetota bacterium]